MGDGGRATVMIKTILITTHLHNLTLKANSPQDDHVCDVFKHIVAFEESVEVSAVQKYICTKTFRVLYLLYYLIKPPYPVTPAGSICESVSANWSLIVVFHWWSGTIMDDFKKDYIFSQPFQADLSSSLTEDSFHSKVIQDGSGGGWGVG